MFTLNETVTVLFVWQGIWCVLLVH